MPIAKAVTSGFLSARGAAPGPAGAGGVSYTHADMASKEYELQNIYNKWSLAQKELSQLRKIIADSNASVDKVMHLENSVAEKDQLIKALEHKIYVMTRVRVACSMCDILPSSVDSSLSQIPNQSSHNKKNNHSIKFLSFLGSLCMCVIVNVHV